MTALVELDTAGGRQQVRIFSLRGAHLLVMLSRTARAAGRRPPDCRWPRGTGAPAWCRTQSLTRTAWECANAGSPASGDKGALI